MNSTESIFKLIQSRKSERSFSDSDIPKEELDHIIKYINEITSPFGGSLRTHLIIDNKSSNQNGKKLGTYGIIKGAKYYLACVVDRDKESLYKLGYVIEKAILYLWSRNLGTCWIGGTFKRGVFAEQSSLKEDEYLPIIIPFGFVKEKKSMTDKMVRFVASSDKRKCWNEVFFSGNFDSPLLPEMAGEYKAALEGVRLAPSASNKQPWRVVKRNVDFEFYLKPTEGYSDKLKFNIQEIDIGIAMAHFEEMLKEEEKDGAWEINLGCSNDKSTDMTLVATWKMDEVNDEDDK